MATDRRSLVLGGLAAAIALPARSAARTFGRSGPIYLTTAAAAGGGYEAAVLDGDGEVLCTAALPGRGHGSAWSSRRGQAVVFARRPGTFALVMDARGASVQETFRAPEQRHFYGHGVFSTDGRLLYTTENDLAAPRGVIGIWDAADGYRRVGEFDSGGIGPHDLALIGGGRTLVIANGGILTHPDTGRTKLNIADMDPNIAFMDTRTGRIETVLRLPRELHKLSLRHLATNSAGRIGIAAQYEGPREDMPPLVLLSDGRSLESLRAPREVAGRMKAYCGDIAMDGRGEVMAASAPRGGLVTFWSVRDGRYLGECAMADGCGVAPLGPPGRFLLTSGTGQRSAFDVASGRLVPLSREGGRRWDNHVAPIPG